MVSALFLRPIFRLLTSSCIGGKAERITALGDLNPNGGFDDQVGIILGFKHGQLAILTHAMTAEFAKECYVVGTKGRYVNLFEDY